MTEAIYKWFDDHSDQFYKDFFTFLSFPSVSTEKEHKGDMKKCASWLGNYLDRMGLTSKIIETSNHPIVFAEDTRAGKDKPTILLYGHYDVQPAEPLEEWSTSPFNAEEKNGVIYARGAQDNKGQLFYTLAAVRYFLENNEPPPINIKICVDGEEEAGSEGLIEVLPTIADLLQADYLLVPDLGIPDENSPAITLGTRGMCQLTMVLKGADKDLHSGEFGGVAYNPLKAMVQVLSKLWDNKGSVAVPHFYDDVVAISEEEKKELSLNADRKKYEKDQGITSFFKEEGFSILESNWLRPTVEINGIGGGYFNEGFKTVIPKEAIAKISCRLVPNQKPKIIAEEVKTFLEKNVFEGMKCTITIGEVGEAVKGSSKSKLAKTVEIAYTQVYGKPCEKILTGGSVCVIADIAKKINCEVVFMGLGLPTDNIHAPNEHFDKNRMKKGFLIIEKTLEGLV